MSAPRRSDSHRNPLDDRSFDLDIANLGILSTDDLCLLGVIIQSYRKLSRAGRRHPIAFVRLGLREEDLEMVEGFIRRTLHCRKFDRDA